MPNLKPENLLLSEALNNNRKSLLIYFLHMKNNITDYGQ